MNMTIHAKSSTGEPYNVEFLVESGKLSVFCNCKAGQFGQLCKHKTELLAGNRARLFDETEAHLLDQLQAVVSRADQLRQLSSRVAESEKTIRREQAALKAIKKELATKLKNGIDVP